MACGRSIFELVGDLMVLGCNFDLCKTIFCQRTQNDDKTSKLKGKKKGLYKSRQKDPPLFPLHEKIRRYRTKVSS